MLTSWRGRGPRRLLGDFLLAGDRPCRALAGPRVGLGALAAHRQALAVTQTAVAAEVHEALDVHRHVAAPVALDHELAVDGLADARPTVVGQFVGPTRPRDADLPADAGGRKSTRRNHRP